MKKDILKEWIEMRGLSEDDFITSEDIKKLGEPEYIELIDMEKEIQEYLKND